MDGKETINNIWKEHLSEQRLFLLTLDNDDLREMLLNMDIRIRFEKYYTNIFGFYQERGLSLDLSPISEEILYLYHEREFVEKYVDRLLYTDEEFSEARNNARRLVSGPNYRFFYSFFEKVKNQI